MPGKNILGRCNGWFSSMVNITSISIVGNGVWTCQDIDPKPFPENEQDRQFDVSGTLSGSFTWTRISGADIFAPATRFIIRSFGCCIDLTQFIFGSPSAATETASLNCLYTDENGDVAFDDVISGDVSPLISILYRIDNGNQEVRIQAQLCSATLSCLGRCTMPCVYGDSGWIPWTSLVGAHTFENSDSSSEDPTSTFTGTLTVTVS